MEIPDKWIASIGAAVVVVVGVLGKFVQKHLDRYIAGLKEDLSELKEKQDKCEETTLDLTERVARMEGERDGFMGGVDHAVHGLRQKVAEDVVKLLEEKKA